ncbi:hypothetical protein CEXT_343821 [Caerostris extrusa]|uniref:Uncharacterized protein n=1 Tax=Caerostris extrusa TaxID=172846 RepID=A0AAV4UUB5_CAEEX|nr:hypothetical protein CEXT_343821 [Caerostris extrusa]
MAGVTHFRLHINIHALVFPVHLLKCGDLSVHARPGFSQACDAKGRAQPVYKEKQCSPAGFESEGARPGAACRRSVGLGIVNLGGLDNRQEIYAMQALCQI